MKATELMIGDWVISNKRGKNEIVKVVSIEGGTNCCWLDADCFSGLVACEDLSPILSTPEILEKNGFGFVKSSDKDTVWNGQWIYEDLELGTCCLNRKGDWPCFINIDDLNIKCEYVHQLQHALRLCGLNELADNFKV